MYLSNTFSSDLLHKILKLVPLTATRPEFYVATMNTVLSNSYEYLLDTLNHMKSIKIKDNWGGGCRKLLVFNLGRCGAP